MNRIVYSLLTALLLITSSCELDGLQQDPNNLAPGEADVDFVLNSLEFGMKDWFWEITDPTMEVTRMIAAEPLGNQYFTYLRPQSHDDLWELTYTSLLADARNLVEIAEGEQLFVHAGIAKVIQAYVLMSTVDFFGDVPYADALNPEVLEPQPQSGAEIYQEAENLLDMAIDDFNAQSLGIPEGDLFYGGDAERWIQLANTLKLRLYLTTRLVDSNAAGKISSLIAEDNFITGNDHWVFQHGTQAQAPDSRHEYYIDNYPTGASDYQSNYFMYLLNTEKGITDPRIRYYFYRQTLENTSDVNEQDCIAQPAPPHYRDNSGNLIYPFCNEFWSNGYWGRDHLDTDGIPPDNLRRTNFGPYPFGGKFDANQGTPVQVGDGLGGAGIHPMMMTFFVDFMVAEAALTLGTPGDPRALLENGVRSSINYVLNFSDPAVTDATYVPTDEEIDAYVEVVLNRYDAAGGTEGQLDVVLKEYYIALFGNGIEAYNMYRRTGRPADIQPALNPDAGPFIRSFFYPARAANQNQNIQQKGGSGVLDERVFWDEGPDDLR